MSGGVSGGRLGGGSSARRVAGGVDASAAAAALPNGGAGLLPGLRAGLPLPVHDHETPSTGGELDDYLRTAWATDHLTPGADAHPEYATDAGLAAVQAQLEAVYTEVEADARFEQLTRKGAADGYAPLDAGGLVPTMHLPPLAVTDTYAVASEAAMLALPAQVGDICIRSDLGETYILATAPASTLANWLEMAAAGQVTSVNGETGAVSLSAADVGAAAVGHSHPSTESEQWRFQDNPTIADPGDGYLRSNTGVLATATTLAISRTTQDGYDIPPTGFGVAGGDTVYVQDRDDNSKWVRYTADEPLARFATYATGAVTVVDSAGSIAHGQLVQVTFHLTGGGGGGGEPGAEYATDAEVTAALATHTALPDAHHAQGHNHTAADGSGALTNEVHDGYSEYVNLGADASTPATNRIRLYSKDNGAGVATLYYISESGQIYELPTLTTGGGGGGSGAPANATYVTLAAESKLSGETALGAGVVMIGTLGARPSAGTAGRLYLATDQDTVYRDSGVTWDTFATRHGRSHNLLATDHPDVDAADVPTEGDVLTYSSGLWRAVPAAGGGGGLPTTGGTMTGALVLEGASSTTNVLQAKLAADTQPRFRADASGKLEWGPGGATAPALAVSRGSTGTLEVNNSVVPTVHNSFNLGLTGTRWASVLATNLGATDSGNLTVGTTNPAGAGQVRLRNTATVAWRNAGNTADLSVGMNASDHLALTVAAGALTTTVGAAGGASALPATPTGYITVTLNGTARKIAFYAV